MADANGAGEPDLRRKRGNILTEVAPAIRRGRFGAVPVAAGIDGVAMPPGELRDCLVPAAGMETGGVAKEDWGIYAGPFPESEVKSIDLETMFDGHFKGRRE
jgi:hypothetical protein